MALTIGGCVRARSIVLEMSAAIFMLPAVLGWILSIYLRAGLEACGLLVSSMRRVLCRTTSR